MTSQETLCSGATPVDGGRQRAVGEMLIAELVSACREETGKFLRGEPNRDAFALELLRRAVCERDSLAWDALLEQYGRLVLTYIRRHPAWSASAEDDSYWVNRTFERFWMAVGPERLHQFPCLAAVLKYLKLCAHSVLVDGVRSARAGQVVPLSQVSHEAVHAPDLERGALGQIAAEELWQVIDRELQDEPERLVARLSFGHDLKPAELYARHPEHFASVADVYRIKRNVLDRLRRSPGVRQFLGGERQ